MSVDMVIYLRRVSMPKPQQWDQAIRDVGFLAELDSEFDPDTATGFRPCKLRGVPTGFEYYSSRLSEHDCEERSVPASFDFSVTLATGSDLRELAMSLIAASVLCKISNGLLFDPQAGDQISASNALAWARDQIASFESEIV